MAATTPVPMFSVLCSAYRCTEFLAETIDSVLAQTRPDWELVVVDNGMSDAIAEIVRGYAARDGRVRLIRQENRRLSGGMAAAAAAATGRFLVPLCSDDLLMPDFCARMAEVLDGRPEIDVLSCDSYLFRHGERLDQARSFLRHRTGLEHRLTLLDLVGTHDVIPYFGAFRRAAWSAAGGYAEGTDLVEDIELYLRLVAAGHDVRVLPQRLARFRIREDSASRDPATVDAFERGRERAYRTAAVASGEPAVLAALARRMRGLRYEQAIRRARSAFSDGDPAAARSAVRTAHRQRPTARSTAVLLALHLVPTSWLRLVHPAKRRLTVLVSRLAGWFAALRRPHLRRRPGVSPST